MVSMMSNGAKSSWFDKQRSLVLANDHSVPRMEKDGHRTTDFLCTKQESAWPGEQRFDLYMHSRVKGPPPRPKPFPEEPVQKPRSPVSSAVYQTIPGLGAQSNTTHLLIKLHLGQSSEKSSSLFYLASTGQLKGLESSEASARCLVIKGLKELVLAQLGPLNHLSPSLCGLSLGWQFQGQQTSCMLAPNSQGTC